MAVGRLLGDRLAERFGTVPLARPCCLIAFAGIRRGGRRDQTGRRLRSALAATGLGVSVADPLSVTAAAGRGDRPAAVNVAALSLVSFAAFMAARRSSASSPISWGLRVGLAMVLPLIVMSFLLAGELRRRVAQPARVPTHTISEVAR